MWSYQNYNVISLCPWNILLQTSMNIMQTIEGNCVDERCVIILRKINKRQLCMQDCNRRKTICFLFLWQQTYAHLISTCLFISVSFVWTRQMSGGTLCLMNDDSNWYLTILLIQNEHMIKWGKNFQRAISRLSKTFDILVPIVM